LKSYKYKYRLNSLFSLKEYILKAKNWYIINERYLIPLSDSQRVHDSIEGGIEKLELSVENLNMRLARLLAEYTASQAKIKQRLAKLEMK